ncbi:SH3 domain-containing protein [Novacetimonas maltaceti]
MVGNLVVPRFGMRPRHLWGAAHVAAVLVPLLGGGMMSGGGVALAATTTQAAAHHAHHNGAHHHKGTAAEKEKKEAHAGHRGAASSAHRHEHAGAASAPAAPAHHHPHPAAVAAPVAAGAAAAGATAAAAAAGPGAALPAGAAGAAPDKGSVTGLPLPRFAAFRADEVNLRAGPGQRYPIDWVYHRRGLPVKIEREFDVWRLVEDADGQKGWVHQATLVGTRTFVIPGQPVQGDAQQAGQPSEKETDVIGRADSRIVGHVADAAQAAAVPGGIMLRAKADPASSIVAVLKPGVVGTLRQCPAGSGWCEVTVKQYSGWLERQALWGLLPQEVIAPS